MKAIQLRQTGGPEVLRVVELPMPEPAAGQVRVRAEAIGVGKPDVMIRTGTYPWMPPLPAIPGNELAGRVDAVGDGVEGVRIGQRVLVSSRELPWRGGCYAECVVVPADAVFMLGDDIDPKSAVALPNYQLAAALLFDSGVCLPGSILVHGAAGGVATALVQTARTHGIQVIGVASTQEKCAFARSSGAHHVIQRGEQDVREGVMAFTGGRGVDLVLDHIGGPGFVANLDLLAPRGTLLSYGVIDGVPQDKLMAELRSRLGRSLGVRCYTVHTLDAQRDRRRELMQQAIELLRAGRIAPPAAIAYALTDAVSAHRALDEARVLGKVVLVP